MPACSISHIQHFEVQRKNFHQAHNSTCTASQRFPSTCLMPHVFNISPEHSFSKNANVFVPGALYHLSKPRESSSNLALNSNTQANVNVDAQIPIKESILLRLEEFGRILQHRNPDIHSYLPSILNQFLQPIWQGVLPNQMSTLSILPEVNAFPITQIRAIRSPQAAGLGFILCKTFSGKWTLVDSSTIKDSSQVSNNVPNELTELLRRLNRLAGLSANATAVYDQRDCRIRVIDLDWCNEKLVIHNISPGEVSATTKEFSIPACGAVRIAGIHGDRIILSLGTDVYLLSDGGVWCGIRDMISQVTGSKRLPVSTQTVAPFIDDDETVYCLRNGELVRGSDSVDTAVVHSKINVGYVSLAFDPRTYMFVLIGFDIRENVNTQYITLYDVRGRFEVSTTAIQRDYWPSIFSVTIDPLTSDVLFIEKCEAYSRYGSLSYSIPALYN